MRAILGWFVVIASAGLVAAAVARTDEEKLPLDKLPKEAVDAVKARFAGVEMVEAAKEVKTFYEVTIKHNGKKMDVTLEGGDIVCIEKTITFQELPKNVAKVLNDKYPNATYKIVEEVIKVEKKDERPPYYEMLLVTADKKEIEVLVNPEGKIIHVEDKAGDKDK